MSHDHQLIINDFQRAIDEIEVSISELEKKVDNIISSRSVWLTGIKTEIAELRERLDLHTDNYHSGTAIKEAIDELDAKDGDAKDKEVWFNPDEFRMEFKSSVDADSSPSKHFNSCNCNCCRRIRAFANKLISEFLEDLKIGWHRKILIEIWEKRLKE